MLIKDVNGNINIDGINVLLAGLYLSTRGMVNVENANSVTYYGTTQDDVIEMEVSNVSKSVHVDTGDGDDRAAVKVKKKPNVNHEVPEGYYNVPLDKACLQSLQI